MKNPSNHGPANQAVEEWLRRTQSQIGLSFSAWARHAGISDTSVTRFLKHGQPLPKLTTLDALARAAGVPPPGVALTADLGYEVDIPVMIASLVRQNGWTRARMSAVDQIRGPVELAHCGAFRVTQDLSAMAGILVNDIVTVDPKRDPANGDLVAICQTMGEVAVLRWLDGRLWPATASARGPVDLTPAITVLGVVRHVQRMVPVR